MDLRLKIFFSKRPEREASFYCEVFFTLLAALTGSGNITFYLKTFSPMIYDAFLSS